ncbi:MAG: TraB/GumN family protein [Myxococcaceae bacterium]|nr:TraB/GumN family protein [Myxococcaceae bacterium]
MPGCDSAGDGARAGCALSARWFSKCEQALTYDERAFVALGTEHLIGPDGLLAQFRAKGCQLERIQPAAR